MNSGFRNQNFTTRDSRIVAQGNTSEGHATRFFRLSQLRRMKGCEQVAAICYRVRRGEVEFLLVQTRGRRWIFPKGSTEAGLTNAQAAALEAFEEAGVHGRIEQAPFTRYVRSKDRRRSEHPSLEITVDAHLCEVLRVGTPQETRRKPTWFPAEKAKRRLSDRRQDDYAGELALVVDRAVARIRVRREAVTRNQVKGDRLRGETLTRDEPNAAAKKDALQKVQFEAFEGTALYGQMEEASFSRYVRPIDANALTATGVEVAVSARVCKVVRLRSRGSGSLASPGSNSKIRLLETRLPHETSRPKRTVIPMMPLPDGTAKAGVTPAPGKKR